MYHVILVVCWSRYNFEVWNPSTSPEQPAARTRAAGPVRAYLEMSRNACMRLLDAFAPTGTRLAPRPEDSGPSPWKMGAGGAIFERVRELICRSQLGVTLLSRTRGSRLELRS